MPPPSRGATATDDEPEARRPRILVPTLVVLGLLVLGFVLFSNFWTDKLWFDSVAAGEVFTTVLFTKTLLFVLFGAFMAVVLWATVTVAFRYRPPFRGSTPEQLSLERYRMAFEPARRVMFLVFPLLLGLLSGVSAASEWRTWLLWRNHTSRSARRTRSSASTCRSTRSTCRGTATCSASRSRSSCSRSSPPLVTHYLYGGIRLQTPGDKVTRRPARTSRCCSASSCCSRRSRTGSTGSRSRCATRA